MTHGKVCSKCNIEKELSEYYKWKKQHPGYMPECKECHKQRQKVFRKEHKEHYSKWQRQRKYSLKEKAIQYKGNKCYDCNISFPQYIYDFHHLDPSSKDFNPSKGFSMPEEILYKELDKCVMLCANCHRTRHWASYRD